MLLCSVLVWIRTALVFVLLVLHSFSPLEWLPRKASPWPPAEAQVVKKGNTVVRRYPCPEAIASPLSFMTFSWFFPYVHSLLCDSGCGLRVGDSDCCLLISD